MLEQKQKTKQTKPKDQTNKKQNQPNQKTPYNQKKPGTIKYSSYMDVDVSCLL